MAAPSHKDATPVPAGSVLDVYLLWLGQWQRAVFFPQAGDCTVDAPWAMLACGSGVDGRDPSSHFAPDALIEGEALLHRLSADILARAQAGQPVSAPDFDAFMQNFARFATLLRDFEQSLAVSQSGVDPLTGLKSRDVMYDELLREANRFNRNGQPFSIVLCSLDCLALVADAHGWEVRESVLKGVAAAIGASLRLFDDAFRIGDDQFLVCLKDCDLLDSVIVAERIRRAIEQQSISLSEHGVIQTTASLGVAAIAPQRAIEDLLAEAESAASRARQNGGNQVAQAVPDGDLSGLIDTSENSLV